MEEKVKRFYNCGAGTRLVESGNYPPEIKDFLRVEGTLLRILALNDKYEALLEVGCMDARMLRMVTRVNQRYVGIDLAPNLVKEGRDKIRKSRIKNSFVEVCSASNLAPIIHLIKDRKTLAFFPFNSFGNMLNPKKVLGEMYKRKLDVLISTYLTDERSTRIREEYYRNCGYSNLNVKMERGFVEFTAEEGLCTKAYSVKFITGLLGKLGYQHILARSFSRIGLAVYASN